jgi:uncharacterized repeat protein (TIGR01451 family)
MKYKTLLLLIISYLLLANFVSAKEIFNGWKNSGDNFTLEGYDFKIIYFKENEKLITDFDSVSIISSLGDCNERENIKVCLDAVDYSDKAKYKSGGIILPGLNIRIYKLEAELTVERSVSNTNINLNDKTEIDVTIKNIGDKEVENIIYEDVFPESFIITSSSLKSFTSSKVKWRGSLLPDKEKKFSYTIQARDFASYDSIAVVRYNTNKKIESNKVTINVNKPYEVITSLTPNNPDVNEDTVYKIEITNSVTFDDLKINLEVRIPKYADFYGYSQGFEKDDHKLVYRSSIPAGNKEELEIKIIPTEKNEYNISTIIQMTLGNNKFKEVLSESFGVGVSNVVPIITIKPVIVRSFDFVNISVDLKNRENEDVNVNAKIESTLFKNKEIKNKSISAASVYNMLDKSITAPLVNKISYFKVKVLGDYIGPADKQLEFYTERLLKVEPREKTVEIIQEFNESVKKGQNLTVNIYVKNLKNQDLDVNLVDAIPAGFLYRGERTKEFTLKRNEKKKAYSYNLSIPMDFKENKFKFVTKLSIKSDDGIYSDTREAEVTVIGNEEKIEVEEEKKINLSANELKEKNINISARSSVDKESKNVEKINFFKRIINFFRELF